jgi:hypothetical protein
MGDEIGHLRVVHPHARARIRLTIELHVSFAALVAAKGDDSGNMGQKLEGCENPVLLKQAVTCCEVYVTI